MSDRGRTSKEETLHCCLYFTANTLSRIITQMAEDEFRPAGLSPSHAFLMMLANEEPGISQKELSEKLHLAPSTVTRFIDKLEGRVFVRRKTEGKNSFIYPTEKGKKLQTVIEKAWESLYLRYSKILGEKDGGRLTELVDKAGKKLEQSM